MALVSSMANLVYVRKKNVFSFLNNLMGESDASGGAVSCVQEIWKSKRVAGEIQSRQLSALCRVEIKFYFLCK